MSQKEYAIIVAGGKGSRMQSEVPKQFLLLSGLPLLMHTIDAFYTYSKDISIVLVLPAADTERWEHLCKQYRYTKKVTIVHGGNSRFQSVKKGLDSIDDWEGLVAIHDGVRPLVSADTIGASFRLAALHGSAVAAVRLKDSIRMTDQQSTKAMDRSLFRLIQTPQSFSLALIKSAYTIEENDTLTDDASVAEQAGHKISLFEGSYENLKVTTPEDMVVAEALWMKKGMKD